MTCLLQRTASGGSASSAKRAQHRSHSIYGLETSQNPLATGLQEGRKHDRLSQSLGTLVNGESGPIGRDLEKDPVRLPEIEAPEPKAIDFAAVGHLEAVQPLTPYSPVERPNQRK